jgi:carbonic anhydrase/acetyltransferase-like protein (isoleucine patch superfamily)
MKAVLWISHPESQPMAQLLDRPFIQHVVEQLVTRGVSRIELLIGLRHKAAARLLGDGTRWGIPIACRPLDRAATKEDFIAIADGDEAATLCGDAGYLPSLPVLEKDGETLASPALFFHDEGTEIAWTGWAVLPEREVAAFAAKVAGGEDWRTAITPSLLEVKKEILKGASIAAASAQQVLDSNRTALEGGYPGLYHDGVEKEPGVWVARGAKIAPTAVVEGPCYIGEEAWIGENCTIGPFAVIGRECVVERGTSVRRSVLSEATYLGPELEVADSSVVQNVIYNVRLGAALEIEEEHVVSGLNSGPLLPNWVKIWTALVLLLAIGLFVYWKHR